MKVDIIEIGEHDTVMIHHNIGNLSSKDIDKYVAKILPQLASIFGYGHVALCPVREGPEWDFTLIKCSFPKTNLKSKKSCRKK